MSTFQLDQCASDEAIVKACAEEGHGDAVLPPLDLHNTKDNVLVPTMMARETVFVTKDRLLARQCISRIPDRNPGIITVMNYPKRYLQMSASRVLLILRTVKQSIPAWYERSITRSLRSRSRGWASLMSREASGSPTGISTLPNMDGRNASSLSCANAARFRELLPGRMSPLDCRNEGGVNLVPVWRIGSYRGKILTVAGNRHSWLFSAVSPRH